MRGTSLETIESPTQPSSAVSRYGLKRQVQYSDLMGCAALLLAGTQSVLTERDEVMSDPSCKAHVRKREGDDNDSIKKNL